MKYLVILLAAFCIAANTYDAEVLKVKDGDTMKLRVEIWPELYKTVNLRVSGIDTPEKKHPFGKRVKDYTKKKIKPGDEVVLTGVSGGKFYGRVLGDIHVKGVGNWANHLLTLGFAKKYDGGSRRGLWTECELEMEPCGNVENILDSSL